MPDLFANFAKPMRHIFTFDLTIIKQLLRLLGTLEWRLKKRLGLLAFLQVISAISEALGLAAVIPLLGAVANAQRLLSSPQLAPWFETFGVTTANDVIVITAVLFGAAVILSTGLRLVALWYQFRVGGLVGSELSIEVFRRTLYQSYEFHARTNSSTLLSGITYDLGTAIGGLQFSFSFLSSVLIILAISGAVFFLNPIGSLLLASFLTVIYVLIARLTKRRLAYNGEMTSANSARLIKALQEALGGIRDVIIDGSQSFFVSVFKVTEARIRTAAAESGFIRNSPRFVIEATGLVALSIFVVATVWSGVEFAILLPTIGAVALAANKLLPAFQQCFMAWGGLTSSKSSIDRTIVALSRPMDPHQLAPREKRTTINRSLQIKDVSFHYETSGSDSRHWVLRDVSLEIPAKSVVALVGATGSGKTTAADILLGLLRPQKGEVLLDGVPLSDEMIPIWQYSIAHVPQAIYLSDTTIAENIAFGVPPELIDMERVVSSARLAQIADFLESRPLKYQEVVGERGIRLSGGQRQRIGIARALYKNANVIVFDEATSALDNQTEHELLEAIMALSGSLTVVMIAHRLSTVRRAHRIYEFAAGRIVASGTYDELLDSSPSFRQLTQVGREANITPAGA